MSPFQIRLRFCLIACSRDGWNGTSVLYNFVQFEEDGGVVDSQEICKKIQPPVGKSFFFYSACPFLSGRPVSKSLFFCSACLFLGEICKKIQLSKALVDYKEAGNVIYIIDGRINADIDLFDACVANS